MTLHKTNSSCIKNMHLPTIPFPMILIVTVKNFSSFPHFSDAKLHTKELVLYSGKYGNIILS
jgi:hypothetical protein